MVVVEEKEANMNVNSNNKFQTIIFIIVQTLIVVWIPASIWWASSITNDVRNIKEQIIELKAELRIVPVSNKEAVEKLERRIEKLEDVLRKIP